MADFSERFGPWYHRGYVDDRRSEPYPWSSIENEPPPVNTSEVQIPQQLTPLARAAGAQDVKMPTPEEVIRFLINVDQHNPYPPQGAK